MRTKLRVRRFCSPVGNKEYRKYLKREGKQAAFSIDEQKLEEEARDDGLWVLRTNTDYPAIACRCGCRYQQGR